MKWYAIVGLVFVAYVGGLALELLWVAAVGSLIPEPPEPNHEHRLEEIELTLYPGTCLGGRWPDAWQCVVVNATFVPTNPPGGVWNWTLNGEYPNDWWLSSGPSSRLHPSSVMLVFEVPAGVRAESILGCGAACISTDLPGHDFENSNSS